VTRVRVFLGLGANLGDRLATLQRAVDLLADRGVRAIASSRVWATAPIGGPDDQPEFLNAVIEIDPDRLEPSDVLAAANEVESVLGRVRVERWGPRTVDIDVLLWGETTSDDPALSIPHPRLHERAFVVMPLLDLEPDPRLPDGRRLMDLPAPQGEVRPYAPPLALPR
jgi:2-amino-4-hydroxy-6-hydroxymethyldihydropteridine diphosphokinase